MSSCDDVFQQIQAEEARKKRLSQSLANLGANPSDDPIGRFVFRGKDGRDYEASFDELWRQLSRDPLATQAFADMAAENRLKPVGAEGQFENYAQMVDLMGVESAAQLGALLTKFTGDWADLNPSDFARTIAVKDPVWFRGQLEAAFQEAGIAIKSDRLGQMISSSVSPFLMNLVGRQTKLRVLEAVTRNNLLAKVQAMADEIAQTSVAPSRELKVAFMQDYYKAIYAHRSARIAKRTSGQLLESLQKTVDAEMGEEMTGSLFREAWTEAQGEAEQLAEELIATTPAELVQAGNFAKAVIEAANKGGEGQGELIELINTGKREGIDPTSGGLDKDWERTWKRNARAAYKDTILASPRTQFLSNYISQKIVYLTEGFRAFGGENAWRLYEGRARGSQLNLLGDDPKALAAARKQPIYVKPLATDFFRNVLKDQLDGSRIAVEAAVKANAVIKQSWQESLQRHFMEGDTPFAGNVDNFTQKGQMSIDDQYEAAKAVLDEPWDRSRFHFQLRDKLHVGLKLLANSKIEAVTGKKLPVYSALQMMSATDHRQGLRAFMTIRANDLLLEQAALHPELTMKEWSAAVDKQLTDQIYRADPSPEQIEMARSQFSMSKPQYGPDGLVDGFTDDEVAAFIASEKLGHPVQASADQIRAKDISVAHRMQQRQTEGIPGVIDNAVSGMRRSETGDALVSFWRSPFNQNIWDLTLAASPFSAVYKVAQASGKMVQGKLTPQLAGEAQAATTVAIAMMSMFWTMRSGGVIVGNGPVEPNARKQWIEKLNAQGKVPNSVLGIPFNLGGIPVLNSLFLMNDAADVIEQGKVSTFDQQFVFEGLLQLTAGQIMRTPGFRQIQMLYDALANGSSNAWEKMGRWVAFMANGQLNPVSSGERLAEWTTGSQWQDLHPPQGMNSADERFTMEQLPEDHPLRSLNDTLRSWIYMSNPGVAHWMGLGLKEKTWLGRDLRRPDGIFRGEWPIGVPGIWEHNGGDYWVETELERYGLLNPPSQIMLGKASDGTPLVDDAIEEINDHLGQVKPTVPFSRDAKHGGTVVWRGPEQSVLRRGEPVSVGRVMVDLTRLMDEATQGRTVREAVNHVLTSKQWQKWEADPKYTTNPQVRDMTKDMRRNQPGPYLLNAIKTYYANLAEDQFERSGTPAAQQYKADAEALRVDGTNIRGEQQKLLQMSR